MQVKTLIHNLERNENDLIAADAELADYLGQGWKVLSIGYINMGVHAYSDGDAYRVTTLQIQGLSSVDTTPATVVEYSKVSRDGTNGLLYIRQKIGAMADEDLDEYQFNGWEIVNSNIDGYMRFVVLKRPVNFKDGKSE